MIAPLFGSITRPLLSPLVSGLRDELFGAFTPRSLFNDGSIGVLYDNNDLTTMFLDAAGTTPATVNGLVGLQLDKSANLALGAELLSTGAVGLTGSATVATYNTGTGAGTVTRVDGANQSFVTFTGLSAKTFYQVTIQNTGSNILSFRQGTFASTILGDIGVGETKTFLGLATISQLTITMSPAAGSGSFTVVSFKAQSGNHRYQTTTGSKPILRGTPTGGNLVTNGDFASGTGWTLNAAASITGGQLVFDGVTSLAPTVVLAEPSTPLSVTIGKVYRVTYTIIAGAAFNGISVSIGGTNGTARTSAGTYVEYITAATTGNFQIITRGSTGVRACSVDNVEVVDVSAGSVTAPYGLQYDGVDDFLQTASVNFSATDKMFVCAGIQRGITTSLNMVVESSAGGVAGSFYIAAPYNATSEVAFVLNGTATGGYSVDNLSTTAPPKEVYSAQYDIGAALLADEIKPRINGATPTLNVLAAGPAGTGNFGNHAIYFGRRAGTSFPLNGLDFGFVIVGKTLTAAQIASTERWIAQRTGVTL